MGLPSIPSKWDAKREGWRSLLNLEIVKARGSRPLCLGYGGGVNTIACLIALHERGVRPDLITFADTGGEKPGTYNYIEEHARPWLKKAGFPDLTTVKKRSMYSSLEDNCLKLNMLPSRAYGFSSCAEKWKIQPQNYFLNRWQPAIDSWNRGVKPIKIIGYDAGVRDIKRSSKVQEDDKLAYWYPLVEFNIDREACEKLILSKGLPLPPKSACFYCPSMKKSEILQLSKEHPDLFARAVAMERNAAENLKTVKGLGRSFSWEGFVKGLEDGPEQPVESCSMCLDEDPEQE